MLLVASTRHTAPLYHPRVHPTLPFLATTDAEHAATHIWTWKGGELMRLGAVGDPGEKLPSGDALFFSSGRVAPEVTWHPTRPLLAATRGEGVQLWECEPGGLRFLRAAGITPERERVIERTIGWEGGLLALPIVERRTVTTALPGYGIAGFSPTGRSLWASGSDAHEEGEEGEPWRSDWFPLEEGGHRGQLWPWDTDLALHPEGELMASFESNQGATLLRFVRVLEGPGGERPETLRRALVLDVDGYCDLTFSPRGDMFLYHGNAYENFCVVHAFPSLERLGIVPLGSWDECTSKLPPRWHERRWSFFENVTFSPDNAGLLLGLDNGLLAELSLSTWQLRPLQSLFARPVGSVRARHSDGLLVVTDFEGLLQLYRLPHAPCIADRRERPLTRSFLASTTPSTRLARWDDLDLTDGVREWNEEALERGELPEDAPTWAQLGTTLRALSRQEQEAAKPRCDEPGSEE